MTVSFLGREHGRDQARHVVNHHEEDGGLLPAHSVDLNPCRRIPRQSFGQGRDRLDLHMHRDRCGARFKGHQVRLSSPVALPHQVKETLEEDHSDVLALAAGQPRASGSQTSPSLSKTGREE